jgi:phosphopantothenoylcysteine decarboxylase
LKCIALGVTGSIAAYKAADLANELFKRGYAVEAILTRDGARFITALTLQTLSRNRVHADMFDDRYPREVEHVSLAQRADLLLVAPATADCIARLSLGLADDLLGAVALALEPETPVLVAPAMNTSMYFSVPVREHLGRLRVRGWNIVEPRESVLACGDLGKGALAEVRDIVSRVDAVLGGP